MAVQRADPFNNSWPVNLLPTFAFKGHSSTPARRTASNAGIATYCKDKSHAE